MCVDILSDGFHNREGDAVGAGGGGGQYRGELWGGEGGVLPFKSDARP